MCRCDKNILNLMAVILALSQSGWSHCLGLIFCYPVDMGKKVEELFIQKR